jgi:hypothetical protein
MNEYEFGIEFKSWNALLAEKQKRSGHWAKKCADFASA